MKDKYTLIGHLANGEAIYVDGEDNILIEKDHSRLVIANVGEWEEANRIWQKSKNRLSGSRVQSNPA